MKKSKVLFFLILIFLFSSCEPTQMESSSDYEQDAVGEKSFTSLQTPFNGCGDWHLTQAFGAYLNDSSKNIEGHHTGEDWNIENDDNKEIYPIADGIIIDYGLVNSKYPAYGYYIIIQHDGNFKIPASNGAHINSLVSPDHSYGKASNDGYSMLDSRDLFSEGLLEDYSLGEADNGGNYSYQETIVKTIYSVYMHLNEADINIGDSVDDINKPIGTLIPSSGNHSAHLHFEIRIGNENQVKDAALNGNNIGGYFTLSQEMVEAGYREPSSIIQANGGQGSIAGQVLGLQNDDEILVSEVAGAYELYELRDQDGNILLSNEKLEYMGWQFVPYFDLLDDGTTLGAYEDLDERQIDGTWEIVDGKILLNRGGQEIYYDYIDNFLVLSAEEQIKAYGYDAYYYSNYYLYEELEVDESVQIYECYIKK